MNRASCCWVYLIAFLLAVSNSTAASTIRYTYTGSPFDEVDTGVPAGVTAASGYLDIEGGLAADLSFAQISGVTQFGFTDGITTVTPDSFTGSFRFSTDNNGGITWWNVSLSTIGPNPTPDDLVRLTISSDRAGGGGSSLGTFWYDIASYQALPPPLDPDYDGPILCVGVECVPANPFAQATTPGTWTQAVVPLPASIWMFVGALAAATWRRRATPLQASPR